jgi:hypothetical protein
VADRAADERVLLALLRDGEASTDLLLLTPEGRALGRDRAEAALTALADRGWVRGHRRRFHGLELAADRAVRRPQAPAWWWELTALGRGAVEGEAPADG